MKMILMAALAAGTLVTATAPADAAQGCGPAFHRGPEGRCFPNRGPGYGPGPGYGRGPGYGYGRGGPGLIVGSFYPGRGYWDGRRYWHNRDRFQGSWRYR